VGCLNLVLDLYWVALGLELILNDSYPAVGKFIIQDFSVYQSPIVCLNCCFSSLFCLRFILIRLSAYFRCIRLYRNRSLTRFLTKLGFHQV